MTGRVVSQSRGPGGLKLWLCGAAIVGVALSGVSAGAASATAPGAPHVNSVKSSGKRSITVAFGKPGSDGGAPISIYRALCTSSDGGVVGANDSLRSPIRVASLTAGKSYTCTVRARNRVGEGPASKPSSAVIVRPKPPGPPAITSVKATGLRGISVAFTKPADDGGAPISRYQAVCASSNGGVARARQASGSPIRVSGLSASRTYTCTVAAGNAIGLGSASEQSSPVVPRPTAPGPPTITSAKATGRRSITVAFDPPADNGGAPITNYLVRCASTDGGAKRSRLAHPSPIRVNGLTAAKTYRCSVAASNNVALGPASVLSKPVVVRSN